MSMQKRIYDKAPILVQNLLLSGVGFQKNRSRYGAAYDKYRQFLVDFDRWSLEEQLEYQRLELIRFVKYAYEHSAFYRELYQDVDIARFSGVEDLKKLPVVDKEMLRSSMEDVVTIARKDAVVHHTSGSTGKPFEVLLRKDDMMRRSAQLDHFKARLGFENLKMKKASFGGQMIVPKEESKTTGSFQNGFQPRFWRYNVASKQMLYSTYHITEETLPFYVASLNQFKPAALDGYISALVVVADYIQRHNIKLEFKPIAIFPTAENVSETARALVERVFGCKVYDQYASSEGAPFITECSHQGLHMELSSGVFEHLDEESDEVLVTSFTTHGTPLIRYRIGDLISFEDSAVKCECGSESLLVKEIGGRALDYLETADGRKMYITNVLGVFEEVPIGVVAAQFVQNSLSEIRLLIQKDETLFKDEYIGKIREAFNYMFAGQTVLTVEFVEQIPIEKSGKFKMIKNQLA